MAQTEAHNGLENAMRGIHILTFSKTAIDVILFQIIMIRDNHETPLDCAIVCVVNIQNDLQNFQVIDQLGFYYLRIKLQNPHE